MNRVTGRIRLEHGSGGALSRDLIESVIYPHFRGDSYPALADAGFSPISGEAMMSTDTYVVDPPFFPGGDIGKLAVFGTCNDLAVCGARPRYLTVGMILEEGFPVADLERVARSLALHAAEADVKIISGDTKVVPRGAGGGIYVNTAGLGEHELPFPLGPGSLTEGDRVICSNSIGAHGLAILAAREGLSVGSRIHSDCAFLYPLCRDLCSLGGDLRYMRDATRGGVAAVVNEMVADANLGMIVREADVPVAEPVRLASEILGLAPLEVANEGVLIAVVSADAAASAVDLLRRHPAGEGARVIGDIVRGTGVQLETLIGTRRILDLPRGLLLPRIC